MSTKTIQCMQCLTVAVIPGDADPHAIHICNCCPIDHHHGQATALCPGDGGAGHPGEPCPNPNPEVCTRVTPAGEDCPGGHCGIGVAGCLVCRPIIHFGVTGDLQHTVN